MKIQTQLLMANLKQILEEQQQQASSLLDLPDAVLNWRATAESWSILECLQHLNLYGHFYIPEIGNAIAKSRYTATATFRSGWLGNYFANSMLPKAKLNKMKTFTAMNPIHSTLDKTVIEEYMRQQEQLLELLNRATKVDLARTKTGISISKFIRLRLGDTFRFLLNHEMRHMQQAMRCLQQQQ
ncbi:DinB superfamily protein [compost metagenome]